MITHCAQELIKDFLVKDPEKRLGTSAAKGNVKEHNFFSNLNWEDLSEGRIKPPFVPNVKNPDDTTNFDDDFTRENPELETIELRPEMKKLCEEEFDGFSFYNKDEVSLH